MPVFAVGRTQDILYILNELVREKRLPPLDVYIDSPLAEEATKVYLTHQQYFDEEARKFSQVIRGDAIRLHFTESVEESQAINRIKSGAIMMAGSGMCEGGRVAHHLKHNLWRPECSIVFTGFQARGTLGRRIVDGASHVHVMGEEIAVRAKVYTINGFSAHADQVGAPRVALLIRQPAGGLRGARRGERGGRFRQAGRGEARPRHARSPQGRRVCHLSKERHDRRELMVHGELQEFFNATDYFIDRNIRQGRGHKVAVYTEYRNYTYNDIQKMVNKTANGFRELGVRVDDRILILMLDVPQFYAVFYGAIKIGGVPIPVNTMLTPGDYEYYLNDSRARVLVDFGTVGPDRHRDQGRPALSPGHDRHLGDQGRPYPFSPDVPPRAGDAQDRVYHERRRRFLALQLRLDRLSERGDPFPVRYGRCFGSLRQGRAGA